jgi:hypothetical protein
MQRSSLESRLCSDTDKISIYENDDQKYVLADWDLLDLIPCRTDG